MNDIHGKTAVNRGSILVALAVITLVLIGYAIVGSPRALFAAFGWGALLIVTLPMLGQSRVDWFSPWSFVVMGVILGCTGEGTCLALNWPNPEKIDRLFTFGKRPEEFIKPASIMLLGLAAMTFGYFGHSKRTRPLRSTVRCSDARIYAVASITLIVSAVASYYYIISTGNGSFDLLSAKRALVTDLTHSDGQFIIYRQIAGFSGLAFLTLLVHTSQKRKYTFLGTVFLAVSFLLFCVVPFYASSRLPIVWLIINAAAILWYAGGRSLVKLAPMCAFCVGVIVLMGFVRKNNFTDGTEGMNAIELTVNHAVMNNNCVGLSKTVNVINAVPDVLPYAYGKTIANTLTTPIPRSLWPQKPIVSPALMIGALVYDLQTDKYISGVPPGMIGELYWNFHIPGVIVGCWIVGFFIRGVAQSFENDCENVTLNLVPYVVGPMRMGFAVLSDCLGLGIIVPVMDMLTAYAFIWVLRAGCVEHEFADEEEFAD